MTREHKLSLIIGFVLILIVGVLISDHMSDQRRIQLAGVAVDDERSTLGVSGGVNPVERWVRDNAEQIRAAAETEAVPIALNDSQLGVTPETLTGPSQSQPEHAVEADPAPFVIKQGLSQQGDGGTSNLADAISRVGGAVTGSGDDLLLTVPGAEPVVRPEPKRTASDTSRTPEVDPKDVKIYRIKDKDSLYAIAKENYGDAGLWQALAAFNEGRVGKDGTVRVGATIKLPPKHVLTGGPAPKPEARKPEPKSTETKAASPSTSKPDGSKADSKKPVAATTSHTVAKGDTLSKIAERYLGTKSRAAEIMALNKITDPNQIRIGQVLKIPAK